MGGRDDHYAQVAGLIGQVEELIGAVAGVHESLESIPGKIQDATGISSDAAQSAAGFAQRAIDNISDGLSALHVMSAELERYGNGF